MPDTIGPLMVDIDGYSLCDEDVALLKSPVVGGLILFTRNYQSHQQLKALVEEIRSVAPNIIIAVDHEGGRVQRFREGFTAIPPMRELGELYKSDKKAALIRAQELGRLIAHELLAFDIDISFTPVLDIDYGVSSVIGNRAFASDTEEIIVLTDAFIKGMRDGGMASTGKHFPGHGAVEADSHIDIPVDSRALEDIQKSDLAVFDALVEKGLDAVMPAHVIYDQVDEQPAGFSRYWLQDVLRTQLRFDGVIFSDDLSMEGATVAGSFVDRAKAALSAGCDMVLVCNHREGALQVKDFLEAHQAEGLLIDNSSRLQRMRLDQSKKMTWDSLKRTELWGKYNQS